MDVTGEAKQREHNRSREDQSERGNKKAGLCQALSILGTGGGMCSSVKISRCINQW